MSRFVFFICLTAGLLSFVAADNPADSNAGAAPLCVDSSATSLPPDSLSAEDQNAGDSLMSTDSASDEQRREDSVALEEENADTVVEAPLPAPDTVKSAPAVRFLYPGISATHDSLARVLIRNIWMFSWDEAERMVRKMQKLERREHAPPLSALLQASMCVVRLQNAGFSGDRAENACLDELNNIAQKGLELSNPSRAPDSLLPTQLLIYGGLKGLLATLHIGHSPIAAAVEGLNALSSLDHCVTLDSSMNDAYLGQGIFFCALSKASPVVRGALKLIGKTVSLEKGEQYLRRSAYHGRYTCDLAKLYLVEFLTPYQRDQANEKRHILSSLKSSYPNNPYFQFLDLEENLCFHPDKTVDPATRSGGSEKDHIVFGQRLFTHAIRRSCGGNTLSSTRWAPPISLPIQPFNCGIFPTIPRSSRPFGKNICSGNRPRLRLESVNVKSPILKKRRQKRLRCCKLRP